MKKLLFSVVAATLVAASSFAQSFTYVGDNNGPLTDRRATITPTTTISATPVIDTGKLLATVISASQQTSFTLVYMLNDYSIVSQSSITSSGTAVAVINQAPLWFQRLKISPTVPMAAGTATVDLINSR